MAAADAERQAKRASTIYPLTSWNYSGSATPFINYTITRAWGCEHLEWGRDDTLEVQLHWEGSNETRFPIASGAQCSNHEQSSPNIRFIWGFTPDIKNPIYIFDIWSYINLDIFKRYERGEFISALSFCLFFIRCTGCYKFIDFIC